MTTNDWNWAHRAIVVALDMAPASEAAVLLGARTAQVYDSLYFIYPAETRSRRESSRIRETDELLQNGPVAVREFVRKVLERAGERPVVEPQYRTRVGPAVPTILQFTVDVQADLLICGLRPRQGMAKRLQASVGAQLIQQARCPVMVAREKNYEKLRQSDRPVPMCADCVAVRQATRDRDAWCEVHAREHVKVQGVGGALRGGVGASTFSISV